MFQVKQKFVAKKYYSKSLIIIISFHMTKMITKLSEFSIGYVI